MKETQSILPNGQGSRKDQSSARIYLFLFFVEEKEGVFDYVQV